MDEMPLHTEDALTDLATDLGRRRRLFRMGRNGVFALVAIDHRDSLQVAFRSRGFDPPRDDSISQFKAEVIVALAPAATGVLVDAEYGAQALIEGAAAEATVVMPLEAQGYGDAANGRTSDLLANWSPARAAHAGADACKLLLPFRADHEKSRSVQLALAEKAVASCHAVGLPLILEPIVYRLPTESEAQFAANFAALVVHGARRLAEVEPDVLKVQFPLTPNGDGAAWCAQIDNACCSIPWVLLGGGADFNVFSQQVDVVCEAGASGYIVGRTAWAGAVTDDLAVRARWLSEIGAPRLREIRERALSRARPFTEKASPPPPYPPAWLSTRSDRA
jgi:tagatose-1,6-bisphosphate aldolase